MSERVAFLFPGQGSQAVGMGKALHESYAVARDIFEEANDTLHIKLDELCFNGPLEALTLTENTQPALVACSWALTRVIEEELGLRADWAAGHSLGEFSALVAARAMTFPDALRAVRARGQAMQSAVPPGVGAMAAILGLGLDDVQRICVDAARDQVVSPANLNGGGQVTVAGHAEAVDRAVALAKDRGAKRAVPLKVSAPFHCSLMQSAATRLAEVLEPIAISPFHCPVVSNVEALPNTDTGRVKDLLVRQVTSAVRWEASIQWLATDGCAAAIEVGPGKVLTGLARRISPTVACHPGEDLAKLRESLKAA